MVTARIIDERSVVRSTAGPMPAPVSQTTRSNAAAALSIAAWTAPIISGFDPARAVEPLWPASTVMPPGPRTKASAGEHVWRARSSTVKRGAMRRCTSTLARPGSKSTSRVR